MLNESNLEAHSIKLIDDSKWTEVAEVGLGDNSITIIIAI